MAATHTARMEVRSMRSTRQDVIDVGRWDDEGGLSGIGLKSACTFIFNGYAEVPLLMTN
jgi:hypothetical protein